MILRKFLVEMHIFELLGARNGAFGKGNIMRPTSNPIGNCFGWVSLFFTYSTS